MPGKSIEIEMRGIAYERLDRKEGILENITCRFPSRQVTALVGASGAGKTTLTQLLMGFLIPKSGEILINGIPLSEIPIDTWHSQISWVPQQASLFADTVLANLQSAKPDASQLEIEYAAKWAGIHQLIANLPRGYLTLVGEGGARFSGGERTRLAFARALLRDSPVVILDEPTANLDLEMEEMVLGVIRELGRKKTVILIAHSRNTIRLASQVIVLEGNSIKSVLTSREYQRLQGKKIKNLKQAEAPG